MRSYLLSGRWRTRWGIQFLKRRTQFKMGAKILSSYVMDTSQDLICDKRLSPCYKNKMEMPGNWRWCILCTKDLIIILDKFSYITDAKTDSGHFSKRRFGKNMAADVSAKKICRNVSGWKHLPKRFVWYVGHIRCMHARPHRRKDQLPLRSLRDLRSC